MKLTRRQILLIVWAACIITVGVLVCRVSGIPEYGWVASLSLVAISLGVPLMRAFTEFSK
jgi:hypothetical protein